MESQPEVIDAVPSEPVKSGFPRWVFVVIGVFVLCCCLSLLVIALLTLMGPVIGNVFSTINQSLP